MSAQTSKRQEYYFLYQLHSRLQEYEIHLDRIFLCSSLLLTNYFENLWKWQSPLYCRKCLSLPLSLLKDLKRMCRLDLLSFRLQAKCRLQEMSRIEKYTT